MQEGRIRLNSQLRSVQLQKEATQQASSLPPVPGPPEIVVPGGNTPSVADEMAEKQRDREAMLASWQTLTMRIQEIAEQNRLQLAELSQAAVELAVLMAEKMVGQQIENGHYAVDRIVQEAVGRLSAVEVLTVRLHPEDLRLLEAALGDEMPGKSHQQVKLEADAALVRGDCLVEAEDQGLLAGVQTQLADMRAALLESLDAA